MGRTWLVVAWTRVDADTGLLIVELVEPDGSLLYDLIYWDIVPV